MEPRSNLIYESYRKSEHKLEGNIHIISVNNVVVNEGNTLNQCNSTRRY